VLTISIYFFALLRPSTSVNAVLIIQWQETSVARDMFMNIQFIKSWTMKYWSKLLGEKILCIKMN